MTTATPGSAALLADAICYIERSKVREILIGQPDENLYVTELLLSEIDALPIVTAGDFRLAAKPDEDGVREATIKECEQAARGPVYKEIYNGSEKGNWSRDTDYGRGRHAAADAVRAISTTGHPKP